MASTSHLFPLSFQGCDIIMLIFLHCHDYEIMTAGLEHHNVLLTSCKKFKHNLECRLPAKLCTYNFLCALRFFVLGARSWRWVWICRKAVFGCVIGVSLRWYIKWLLMCLYTTWCSVYVCVRGLKMECENNIVNYPFYSSIFLFLGETLCSSKCTFFRSHIKLLEYWRMPVYSLGYIMSFLSVSWAQDVLYTYETMLSFS